MFRAFSHEMNIWYHPAGLLCFDSSQVSHHRLCPNRIHSSSIARWGGGSYAYYTWITRLVTAKTLLPYSKLESSALHLGYCNFYFPHIGLVGGLVQRQLNELRRVQQVSYLLLFCRRSPFNSLTVFRAISREVNQNPCVWRVPTQYSRALLLAQAVSSDSYDPTHSR